MTPSQIVNILGKADSSVARCLKDLTSKGIIKCVNPEARKGRLYTLTAEGKKIQKRIMNG